MPQNRHDSTLRPLSPVAKRIRYKHYYINSRPLRVLASGKWELHITIFWETEDVMNMRSFTAPGLYESEDEADLQGIAYGQHIIEGKITGVNLS
jgi:hypothetical protein